MFGFDTNRLKAVAFGVSGLLAGIGGALYAPQQGLVTPQLCGFGALGRPRHLGRRRRPRPSCSGRCSARSLIGALDERAARPLPFWEIADGDRLHPRRAAVSRRDWSASSRRSSAGGRGAGATRRARSRRRREPAARPPAQLAIDDVERPARRGHASSIALSLALRAPRHLLRHRPERRRQDLDLQHADRRAAGAARAG